MNIIIQSTLKTLQKSQLLLDNLTDEQLCNASVPPYHSSIGSHIRHILDFYECVFNMSSANQIDLTARSRNTDVEEQCDCAKDYLNLIISKLKSAKIKIQKRRIQKCKIISTNLISVTSFLKIVLKRRLFFIFSFLKWFSFLTF